VEFQSIALGPPTPLRLLLSEAANKGIPRYRMAPVRVRNAAPIAVDLGLRRRARENERTAARRISATVGQPRPVSATGVPWVRATRAVRGPAKTPRCRHFFWRHRPHLFRPWDARSPMGHHELGRLSGPRKWRQVIALISGGADGARRSTGGSFMFLCMATHLKKPIPNPPP
jgi:hypothetical protein